MTPEEVATAPSVVKWFDSARLHSDPDEEKQLRYGLLAEFCDHVGQAPDELAGQSRAAAVADDHRVSSTRPDDWLAPPSDLAPSPVMAFSPLRTTPQRDCQGVKECG